MIKNNYKAEMYDPLLNSSPLMLSKFKIKLTLNEQEQQR